ncbi:NADP-dependent oxidoreductase domain-containing protein [Mycena alexandri]|uniref:NADP-dependent oxidoreductase domain-containing protein n=1 Tax=Mycena alexandri TaxID=1745969 RepID=A0AAD6SHF2_9AGAR|nr:NADP-dependent oxidoreductase domain-containing protein [Mycena alexandri]
MAAITSIKLNTGRSIPAIGLGAAASEFTPEGLADTERWFLSAIKAGYRHFDTAYVYKTEGYLGAAIRASGVPREEFFVTTKLPWFHSQDVARSFDDSLRNLGLDYVDLYLIHTPQIGEYAGGYDGPTSLAEMFGELKILETPTFNDTWAELERIHESGRARAIGVSNFSFKTLEQLSTTAKIVPAVNQVELHPYLAQTDLLEYCRKKGIVVAAYTPSGRDKVRSDPTLVALGAKYNVTSTQISLAWHVARGVVPLPSSTKEERQKQNITLPTLSPEDVESVTALDRYERIFSKIGPDGKLFGWTAEQLGW